MVLLSFKKAASRLASREISYANLFGYLLTAILIFTIANWIRTVIGPYRTVEGYLASLFTDILIPVASFVALYLAFPRPKQDFLAWYVVLMLLVPITLGAGSWEPNLVYWGAWAAQVAAAIYYVAKVWYILRRAASWTTTT